MSYQTSPELSREAKYIIRSISENDSSFTKLLENRYYSTFENEILFFIKNNFDEKKDDLKLFTKTLQTLSFISPSLKRQNRTLLEIIKNKPAFSDIINNILYDNKSHFTDAKLISPLLDAYESKNLNDKIFEILARQIIKNESSDRKILDGIYNYTQDRGYNASAQKLFKYVMADKAEYSALSNEMIEKYVALKKETVLQEYMNQQAFTIELEDLRLMNKSYSDPNNQDVKNYIFLLEKLSNGQKPPENFSEQIHELTGDLVQISVNEPHLEKNVIRFLEPIKKQLQKNLNTLIYYSTNRPKIIDHFLQAAKESDNISADKVSRLVVAAFFNEEYKQEFLNIVTKGIRNTDSSKNINSVFFNVGSQIETDEKKVLISLFDKDIQYLMKTALYESKMNGIASLSFAENITKRMNSELSKFYLADVENSRNIASYNRFIRMATKSPLINKNPLAQNHFLALLYTSEQTVCLPPEAKKSIQNELGRYNLQNGAFLNGVLKQCKSYKKNYDAEINTLSPSEFYDNTFSLIEKNLSENNLDSKEKEMIYQSLSKIEENEINHKDDYTKLMNTLSASRTKAQKPLSRNNYGKGKEK